ncbi:MAG TPA: SMI1/KNR4 family protein [Gemmatales bacterium]|nr:SMI1/KNR4 family protein [Gemmatales bacterium]
MQHILLCAGHDERLDCRNQDCDILNPLPLLCKTCQFAELDHVPQPYFLMNSKAKVPNEVEQAHAGNLLVRERIKQVLELVAPGQCRFYPTVFHKTNDPTPWYLAVPLHQVETATVVDIFPCKACGRCTYVHPGTHYKEIHFGVLWHGHKSDRYTNESEYDILKTSTWWTSGPPAYPEISRMTYCSLRLQLLLQAIRVDRVEQSEQWRPNPSAGPGQPPYIKEPMLMPTKEDQAWIAEMKSRLAAAGIPLQPPGTNSKEETRWFNSYLKKQRQATPEQFNIKSIEKELGVKLPPSFVKHMKQVGPASFEAEEGYTVTLLPADKVYVLEDDMVEENHPDIRALVFAETDFGDLLCFDAKPDQPEFAVLQLNHETFAFEPYTANFVQCLQRLVADE